MEENDIRFNYLKYLLKFQLLLVRTTIGGQHPMISPCLSGLVCPHHPSCLFAVYGCFYFCSLVTTKWSSSTVQPFCFYCGHNHLDSSLSSHTILIYIIHYIHILYRLCCDVKTSPHYHPFLFRLIYVCRFSTYPADFPAIII